MSFNSNPDIVVVGAGAGGLGAARTAVDLGLSVQVLEAKDRVGGRCWTDESMGVGWDPGAHWLHNADHNFFARFAEREGWPIDTDGWKRMSLRAREALDAHAAEEWEAYWEAAYEAIDRAGAEGRDVPASEVIPPHPRWGVMFASFFAALAGVEPDRTSALDVSRYDNGYNNWRVAPGYGALVAHYGRGLPVALDTPVTRIDWSGDGVRVETAKGALSCRAVVVTASTSTLAEGHVRFAPDLPAATRDAIESVPLGEAEKVAFRVRDELVAAFPRNSHIFIEHSTPEHMRFQVRPLGTPVIIAWANGRFARALHAEGRQAMIDFAEAGLVKLFGADMLKGVVARATSDWLGDPYIRGGYSCAKPGKAGCRAKLREPVAGRIFFAGETTHPTAFGTVHGARDEGEDAVRRIAASFGRTAPAATASG